MTDKSCKTPLSQSSPYFEDTPRATDKTRVCRYVLQSPDGVPLSKIVRDVFGSDANGDGVGPDYQLTRRLVNNADIFRTERMDGHVWVEPIPDALNLIPQLVNGGSPRRNGDGHVTVSETEETGSSDRPMYAKDRVRNYFDTVVSEDCDSIRKWILE